MSVVSDEVILNWSGSQSVGPDAAYVVSWTTETLDASNYWVSGAPTRITVPTGKAGYHFFTFEWTTSATTGYRAMADLNVFNSSNVFQRKARGPVGRDENVSEVSMLTKLSDGDYVTCSMYYASNARTLTLAKLAVVRFNG